MKKRFQGVRLFRVAGKQPVRQLLAGILPGRKKDRFGPSDESGTVIRGGRRGAGLSAYDTLRQVMDGREKGRKPCRNIPIKLFQLFSEQIRKLSCNLL